MSFGFSKMDLITILQLLLKIHGSISRLHMTTDAICQDTPFETKVLNKHQHVPEILQESAFGNGGLQPTNSLFTQQRLSTSNVYGYTQTMLYGMQAVSSFGATWHTGLAQSLAMYIQPQVLYDNWDLDYLGDDSQNYKALTSELQIPGMSSFERCYNLLPISVEIHNFALQSSYFPCRNQNIRHEFCEFGPSSQRQYLDYGDLSQCPPLIFDNEDDFGYSDFETGNGHIPHPSEYNDTYLAMASTLAAFLLVRGKGNVDESKRGKHQIQIQNTDSKSESARDCRDDHSSCFSSTSRARKRNFHHDSRDEDWVDDSGDDGRKRARGTPSATGDKVSGPLSLLACPFYKFDHRRYSEVNLIEKEYRGCSSVYMTDISRLKQHLYRVHGRPAHYCSSCYTVFDARSQLDDHIRRRPPCQILEPRFTEKITDQQLIQLKKKQYGKTMAQNWYTIFKILFPMAKTPESPYLEDPRQVSIRTYLSIYQEIVQSRLLQELGLDEGFRQSLSSVLEQSTSQVLQQLAQERVSPPTEGSNQPSPRQSSCTSYHTNQIYDPDYLYTDAHNGNSDTSSEFLFPSTWQVSPYEVANSQPLSPANIALSPQYLSTDSSSFRLTRQYYHGAFAETAEQVRGASQNFVEQNFPCLDSEYVFEDDL